MGCEPEKIAGPCDFKPATQNKATKLCKAARDRIEEVIDLTAAWTITGKHLKNMSDSLKEAVIETAEKNHKKLENKNVKSAVLEVQYAVLCHAAFVEHLKEKVTPATQMQHGRRQRIIEEQEVLAKIKIGDCVFATDDMSPGMNSEGRYGCVIAGNYKEKVGDSELLLASVDVHWHISNGFERHVKLDGFERHISNGFERHVKLEPTRKPCPPYVHERFTKSCDAVASTKPNTNWVAGIWPTNSQA